jgi:hypothetical protein
MRKPLKNPIKPWIILLPAKEKEAGHYSGLDENWRSKSTGAWRFTVCTQ